VVEEVDVLEEVEEEEEDDDDDDEVVVEEALLELVLLLELVEEEDEGVELDEVLLLVLDKLVGALVDDVTLVLELEVEPLDPALNIGAQVLPKSAVLL
jgi:hypothetical protein